MSKYYLKSHCIGIVWIVGSSSVNKTMSLSLDVWEKCLGRLQSELSTQQFCTWIRPLQVLLEVDTLRLLAPNQFVRDWVSQHYRSRIIELLNEFHLESALSVSFEIGSRNNKSANNISENDFSKPELISLDSATGKRTSNYHSNLNATFTFQNFVEGKSNQLARAASMQVAGNPGDAYNPLFIYGGVGLGKTHLMHAIGNHIIQNNPEAKVIYLHSERFVADMVKALQTNSINEFKRFYRSLNALLIDDIQFFAGKDRSQEEFFHTFNALLKDSSKLF